MIINSVIRPARDAGTLRPIGGIALSLGAMMGGSICTSMTIRCGTTRARKKCVPSVMAQEARLVPEMRVRFERTEMEKED